MGVTSSNVTANVSWAYTLYDDDSTSDEYTLWFSAGGLNYTDDTTLGYDVCGIQLQNDDSNYAVSDEAARLGAADTGNCLATLGQDCVDALNAVAANAADLLVGNPTPGPKSNLTNGVLPTICTDIGTAVQNNLPKQCLPYFGGSVTAWAFSLTDYHNASTAANPSCCSDLTTYDACTITDTSAPLNVFHPVSQLSTSTANDSNYDEFAFAITPIMTVSTVASIS